MDSSSGQPPNDSQHINDVMGAVSQSGTQPVRQGDVWNKMKDWNQLTEEEKTSVINFLSERFSVEDLELAYDEYIRRKSRLPTVHDYRVFILNWEGRRDKTQSLAQMKKDIDQLKLDLRNLEQFIRQLIYNNFNTEIIAAQKERAIQYLKEILAHKERAIQCLKEIVAQKERAIHNLIGTITDLTQRWLH